MANFIFSLEELKLFSILHLLKQLQVSKVLTVYVWAKTKHQLCIMGITTLDLACHLLTYTVFTLSIPTNLIAVFTLPSPIYIIIHYWLCDVDFVVGVALLRGAPEEDPKAKRQKKLANVGIDIVPLVCCSRN